jgi:hypothetical protein
MLLNMHYLISLCNLPFVRINVIRHAYSIPFIFPVSRRRNVLRSKRNDRKKEEGSKIPGLQINPDLTLCFE